MCVCVCVSVCVCVCGWVGGGWGEGGRAVKVVCIRWPSDCTHLLEQVHVDECVCVCVYMCVSMHTPVEAGAR